MMTVTTHKGRGFLLFIIILTVESNDIISVLPNWRRPVRMVTCMMSHVKMEVGLVISDVVLPHIREPFSYSQSFSPLSVSVSSKVCYTLECALRPSTNNNTAPNIAACWSLIYEQGNNLTTFLWTQLPRDHAWKDSRTDVILFFNQWSGPCAPSSYLKDPRVLWF